MSYEREGTDHDRNEGREEVRAERDLLKHVGSDTDVTMVRPERSCSLIHVDDFLIGQAVDTGDNDAGAEDDPEEGADLVPFCGVSLPRME